MGILTESLFGQLGLVVCTVLFAVVIYFKIVFRYWSRCGVPYIEPSFPFGNFQALFTNKKCMAELSYDLYNKLKSNGYKYGGIFFINSPIYMPVNPAYVKHILSTDFEHFSERGTFINEQKDPLAINLFNLPTEPWRILRSKLTPSFTSGKIKTMFHTMLKCGENLVDVCTTETGPIDINDVTVRYTVDIIGSVAFGIECNSLRDPNAKFRKMADEVINPPLWTGLKFFLALNCPQLMKLANLGVTQENVIQFFLDIVTQTIEYREKNNIERNDFMQLLINMKNKDEANGNTSSARMTTVNAAAQAFVFFAAGFETSSMTVNFCLFELSQNQELQEKVRADIQKVIKENDGKITYDGIMSMTYLDKCVQETLRKYPPLGFLNRVCTKDYQVPDTDVVLEKGTKVLVSLLGLQRDPEYFPDPERFDPERFSEENKASRTPYTYMPFGEGHRICIGARFGSMQTKVCLAVLIANLKFTLNPKTKLPLTFMPTSFVFSLQNQIWLNAEKV